MKSCGCQMNVPLAFAHTCKPWLHVLQKRTCGSKTHAGKRGEWTKETDLLSKNAPDPQKLANLPPAQSVRLLRLDTRTTTHVHQEIAKSNSAQNPHQCRSWPALAQDVHFTHSMSATQYATGWQKKACGRCGTRVDTEAQWQGTMGTQRIHLKSRCRLICFFVFAPPSSPQKYSVHITCQNRCST